VSPPLDGRLMSRGERVERIELHRGWLAIRRADGPAGVVLEIRIPGCPHEDQPHDDQADAIAAAGQVMDEYRRAVKNLAS
jgi:hypothetical protein